MWNNATKGQPAIPFHNSAWTSYSSVPLLSCSYSARSTRLGRRKDEWQSFEIYCQPWSPNQPAISQKMAPISAEKMGTMGNVCSWFLHLVSRNGPLGSVRGVDLTRPVRINYQHQRQLLSFALSRQSDHPSRRQLGHQYIHNLIFCIGYRFWNYQFHSAGEKQNSNSFLIQVLSIKVVIQSSCCFWGRLFIISHPVIFSGASSHVLPGFLPSPSRANIQIWTHV